MVRRKFLPSQPQAIAERAEQIRRLHQLRRMLLEIEAPVAAFAGEMVVDEIERERFLRSARH